MEDIKYIKDNIHQLYVELKKIEKNDANYILNHSEIGRFSRKIYNISITFENLQKPDYKEASDWFYATFFSILGILGIGMIYITGKLVQKSSYNPYILYGGIIVIFFILFVVSALLLENAEDKEKYHNRMKYENIHTIKKTLDDIHDIVRKNKKLKLQELGKKILQKVYDKENISIQNFLSDFKETYKDIYEKEPASGRSKDALLVDYHNTMEHVKTIFAPLETPENLWKSIITMILPNEQDGFRRRLADTTPLLQSELSSIVQEYNDIHKQIVKEATIALQLGAKHEDLLQEIPQTYIVLRQYIDDFLIPESQASMNEKPLPSGFVSYWTNITTYDSLYRQWKALQDVNTIVEQLDTKPFDPLDTQKFIFSPTHNNTLGIGLTTALTISIAGLFLCIYVFEGTTHVNSTQKLFTQIWDDGKHYFTSGERSYILQKITYILPIVIFPILFYGRALLGVRLKNEHIDQNTNIIKTELRNALYELQGIAKQNGFESIQNYKGDSTNIHNTLPKKKLLSMLQNVYESGTAVIHAYNKPHKFSEYPDTTKPLPIMKLLLYISLFIGSIIGITWLVRTFGPPSIGSASENTISKKPYSLQSIILSLILVGILIIVLISDMIRVYQYYQTESYEFPISQFT